MLSYDFWHTHFFLFFNLPTPTVEQMKQASVSQLESKREELTVAMQSTQAGCDFVTNLLSNGSDVDILTMEAQVGKWRILFGCRKAEWVGNGGF